VPSDEWLKRARDQWTWRGATRPGFAVEPGPGQESVWDYPRPPRLVADPREVVVQHRGVEIARSHRTVRLLETSHPPTFYIPRADVHADQLVRVSGASFCEWKGPCSYYDVAGVARAAWSYDEPFAEAEVIRACVAFYATELECFVGGERARPQRGGFYGGWITSELTGPFKGDPGTSGW
jgi:uncharacterized protein (DUF427 family)